MASKSSYLIGGLAIVAMMVGALPAAQGMAPPPKNMPAIQVNRGAKGDRLVVPRTIAVKKAPTETARDTIKNPEQTEQAPDHGRLRPDVQPGDRAGAGARRRPLRRLIAITSVC